MSEIYEMPEARAMSQDASTSAPPPSQARTGRKLSEAAAAWRIHATC
jgi:hypothetical protein